MKLAVLAVVTLLAFQTYPPPFPRDGVTQLLDNTRVAVWQVRWTKGRPTPMHEHRLDLVGIAVEGGQVRVTLPDGAAQTGQPTRPGDVVFLRRGVIHVEESVADGGVSVAIELRDAPASARPADTSAPEAFPREGARLVLENDRAAIWDYQWVPGRAVARHVHTRDTVLVPIVAGEVRVQFRSGETRLSRLVPGEALFFSEAEAHREEASAGSPRAILVELK